ncbi:adenine deaminase [Falsirhodobacter sp. 20TX0035]|uniref:adenine deaminase n=1 Tax=Falsirhodobacter sp. 20TX0035 TaxID=3022019 RepID=UPI00232F432A|nr:adenine deaminase C-terminal domain-containing protein [Falsirhodobacter sp. 20TX0035]MDB6453528.1 adenine deaminase C-terminal domain-containing protein [Falsirhodobacter sp. 20TX0035]
MTGTQDLNDTALRDRAVAAATGRASFDVLLCGGTVVDVATGELRPADVGLVGALIASVHPSGSRADATRVIDVSGRFVAPGLIDTHMHIESSMTTPRRYAEVVVPQGTTTVVWDPHEVGNVAGLAGIAWAMDAIRDLPLRVLALAPSCVPSAPGLEVGGAVFGAEEMAHMLAMPEICGVAEVMDMRGVLDRSRKMRGIVGEGLASGKLVCGHARGLGGADLQGYAAAGVTSDHEITSGEDVLAKLRAGLTVELRGSHDYVLPGVVEALGTLPHLPQTVTICTDDVFPDDLILRGGMVDVVRRLVGHGMPALDALRAATLNAAGRIGRSDLGLVAAGRRADLIVIEDLTRFRMAHVFASGREVGRDGVALDRVCGKTETRFTDSVKVPDLVPGDFVLRTTATGRVAVNTVFRPRFTELRVQDLPVEDGCVLLPPDKLMMAVIHRHGQRAAVPSLGVLDDWGCWTGAIATTVAHDSHNLCVFGHDPVAMAAAANALRDCGGGMAVAQGDRVLAVLPLPVCGLLSDAPAERTADALVRLRAAAEEVADWAPPLRTFKALVGASLACNPGPRVTDLGIGDGATGALIGPFA